jgi:hypothetical protein
MPRPCLWQEHADPQHILGQGRFVRSTRPHHVRPESAVPAASRAIHKSIPSHPRVSPAVGCLR